MTVPLRAALYLRVSTARQAEHDVSIPDQKRQGELNKRATETDLRLKRLYDAIEAGVADLDDPALKERVASIKALRD